MSAAAAASSEGPVRVVVEPASRTQRAWDPSQPPTGLSSGDHDALTDLRPRCRVQLHVTETSRVDHGDAVDVLLRVDGADLTLFLDETVYLPASPTPALLAHEDGHCLIAEAFWARAARLASGETSSLVGSQLTARGPDPDAAARAVVDSTAASVGRKLVDHLLAAMQPAQDAYDALTDHGRRDDPSAPTAASQALSQHPPP